MLRRAVVAACATSLAIAAACSSFESEDVAPSTDAGPSDDAPGNDEATSPVDATVDPGVPKESLAKIAAGDRHACAIRNGEVYCWGDNVGGAVGQGPDEACGYAATPDGGDGGPQKCRPVARKVPGLDGKTVVELAAGNHTTCARTSAHELWCWGTAYNWRLGIDPASVGTKTATPVKIPLPPVYGVALGSLFGCARVLTDGRTHVWCWGFEGDGETGRGNPLPPAVDGGPSPEHQPAPIVWDAPVDEIRAAAVYPMACARSGTEIRCWAGNVDGSGGRAPDASLGDQDCPYLSLPGSTCNATPLPVPGAYASLDLVAGFTVCGTTTGGEHECWGWNINALLGQNTSDNGNHPSPAIASALPSGVVTMGGRFQHVCTIDKAGVVACFGTSLAGELGVLGGTKCMSGVTCRTNPSTVTLPMPAVEIAPSISYTIAMTKDEKVWAWGTNAIGMLGHVPGNGDVSCAGVLFYVDPGACSPDPAEVVLVP